MTTKAAKSERRQKGTRVHFEALVAVGSAESDGGFDAESVDVSPQGMRLRAAHLPEQGERLICRFEADGSEGEVVATGEVSWVNPEDHGGEFGLKFVDLDPDTSEALRAMCAELGGDDAEPQPELVPRGARVRLHIEGLGSPMKARVRQSAGGDVEVGSNLEFLKLDRSLGMEDVERGTKQSCFVDSVKVEVDPQTKVPQLVVGLRFTEEREAAKTRRAATADDAVEGDEEQPHGRAALSTLAGAGSKAKEMGKGAMAKVGPALGAVGRTAMGAMRGIFERVRQKREAGEGEREAPRPGPRRVTAPPPSGTLRADGRRLVRDDGDEAPAAAAKPGTPKRALMIGGLVGLLAIGGVAAASKLGHKSPPLAAAGAPTTSALALPAASGDGANANVPFFGATPMSTVEQVPPPPPAGTAVAQAGDPPPPAAGGAAKDADDDGALQKDWGEGNAKGGAVLKLKMDQPLEGFRASQGDMGFTVVVPGHKFLGNAAELAKKDKRLALFNVTNKPDGAEITVQFREEVPGHKVKVNGSTLEIRFAGDKKVAKKGDKNKKKGDKKKPGAKKPAAKKPN